MRAYTKAECERWLEGLKRTLPEESDSRISFKGDHRNTAWQARWTADHLPCQKPALLWLTEWGIWPSSENWRLYDTLRKVHGEHRLLYEAPGHLFADFESADLASFLQVAMMNGWGGYLIGQADQWNLFFSHDEYMNIYCENPEQLAEIRNALE